MSLRFLVEQSVYAPNKTLIIKLDGKEMVRAFLNDHDAPRIEAELEQLGLLGTIDDEAVLADRRLKNFDPKTGRLTIPLGETTQ